MQGVNDYEDYATVVIIGRLQPGISEIETVSRAVFAQDERPILEHASGPLPPTEYSTIMADGSIQCSQARCHPDPRVQSILAQTRECGTLQAIARLRLIAPNRKKRVVILSNLPLPGLPITHLSPLAALERGLENEPDWTGYLRMERALRAIADQPVRGTRLSASGIAADLPRDFETEASARRFRRGRSTAQLLSLCQRIAAANGWPISVLSLKRPEGGKSIPAIVLDKPQAAGELARHFWPAFAAELS
jgi:hypothetical protein